MHEHYARQDPDFVPYEVQRKEAKTFEAQGLSQKEIVDYLATENGQLYLDKLQAAAPDKSFDEIINRAIGQIKSGSTIPKLVVTDSPLVKIVPVGKEVSDYSPFFTTMDELRRASQSKATLADLFGLPLTSEASKYSVFEITPIKPTEVFVSKVAPTTEFGGSVARSGDVFQSIVTNRGEWSAPRLIGTLDN